MFSFLRLFFLFYLLIFTQSTQAEPDFKIPPIQESMKKMYQIQEKDFTFEDKHYRLFIAVPPKTSQKLTALYTLDGNAQFPIAVNAVNPHKPLPLIIGIGYISDKAYAIEERMRDYTFPAEGAEFAKGGKAADFLRFIQQDVKPYISISIRKNNISLAILLVGCLDYTCSSINRIYFNITHWQALLFGGEMAHFCLKMNLGLAKNHHIF